MTTRRLLHILVIFILLAGCQLSAPAATPTPAPAGPTPEPATVTRPAGEGQSPGGTPTPTFELPDQPTPTRPAGQGEESEQPVSFSTRAGRPFMGMPLAKFEPSTYPAGPDALPLDLEKLSNPGVIQGLTEGQRGFLTQNGFVVMPTAEKQFRDIRESVSKYYGQPYYLTTDAAYHALHVTFDEMLESLERERLRPVMARLLRAVYDKVEEYAEAGRGTPIENDALLTRSYLAVALKLFYPDSRLEAEVEQAIQPQIDQIMGYGGREESVLIPNFSDDYGAYRPVGHYAGRPELEDYFRGMTWLGRVGFFFKDPEQPGLVASRAPLIITLALRSAEVDGTPATEVWAGIYEIIDYMVGPSDDPGPVELSALMDKVYGSTLTLADLADEAKWQAFLEQTGELPAPAINSTFAEKTASLAEQRGWRFMGQRFTLDSFIFQSLIYSEVGTREKPRKFPTGLDVAAAFGSQQAMTALEAAGETEYARYSEQMEKVQALVESQPEAQWLNRFYTSWLYAFRPQVEPKGAGYPPYMRTDAWGYKEVNSLLGSWAELKHDTVLYFKMPEGLGGGGPPVSGPAPAYVEPNPNVFYRLAYAARELMEGLRMRTDHWKGKGWTTEGEWGLDVESYLMHLDALAARFSRYGEIAALELQGQPPTVDDYEVIQSCLEYKECRDIGPDFEGGPKPEPIPVVAAVSGAEDDVLEVGVGELNRIFVAVPIEGKLQIAQGGVFSYYEFTQPRSNRLTDEAWREKLASSPPPALPWQKQFLTPGGEPNDVLAFRVGDIYILTEAGYTPPLNMRAGPSKNEEVLRKLGQEEYLEIIDGPVINEHGTWWKVQVFAWDSDGPQGWVLEDQAWYRRSVSQ